MMTKITQFFLAVLLLANFQQAIAQPFYCEGFKDGIPATWSTGDELSPTGGLLWNYCPNFWECPPTPFNFNFSFSKEERFESKSVENGYAFASAAVYPLTFRSFLQTGAIDCTAKNEVFLKFSTHIFFLESSPDTGAVLQVKAGNGTWTTFPVFPNLNTNVDFSSSDVGHSFNPFSPYIDISSVAANQQEVFIRWQWTGIGEFSWAIDDVELYDHDPLNERVVWGEEPGEGDFANGLNGWSVAFIGDTCKWRWDANGTIDFPDPNLTPNAVSYSPTLDNGVALVNATWCLGGTNDFTRSDLVSPIINLSGVAPGTRLALEFHQTIATADPASLSLPISAVSVHVNGTVVDTINANVLSKFGRLANNRASLPLPASVAGSANVQLRFMFAGSSFLWVVDDVRIVRRHDNDLRIVEEFVATAPNAATPKNQLTHLGFAAAVENVGNLPQDFATLFAFVVDNENGEVVFRDTLSLGTLQPGTVVTDSFFSKTFLPPNVKASYSIYYRLKADLPDQDTTNNVARRTFEVTDKLFAKDKGLKSITSHFRPTDFADIKYEVGNCYFIPNGQGHYAESMSFAFQNAQFLKTAVLEISLYKWKTDDSYGDANGDTLANPDEFELVGAGTHVVTGTENNTLVTEPLIALGDPEEIPLEDSTYYFVTINYDNPVINQTTGQPEPFRIAGSEDIDYTASFWLSYQLGLPRYVSMHRFGNDDFFVANAWALRRIPLVRLNLSGLVGSEESLEIAKQFTIQPNPASNFIVINRENDFLQKHISIKIYDLAGRLVEARHFENAIVSQQPIPVSSLSNGAYILRVVTDNWNGTAKFVVQK